jgi:hypothetical protein
MNDSTVNSGKFLQPHLLFRIFKYSVYCLLAYNATLFFKEDLAASAVTFGDTVTWRNVVEAYSASIDTIAWIVLLLLFELETAVIPDEKLKGNLKWLLSGVRGICYFFIAYAFYGYCQKYLVLTNLLPFQIADICSLVGTEWNFVQDMDDYPAIDAVACVALQGQDLVRIAGTEIIGTVKALDAAVGLATIDIINSATWLLIVILLEVEVWMQLKEALTDRFMLAGKVLKAVLYALLFYCAVYWGINGSFLDFWDAFLWLVAFIFIEMNIFQWHDEIEEANEAETRRLESAGAAP